MKFRTASALLLTLPLSGCFSAMLWGEDNDFGSVNTRYKTAAKDHISAFGMATETKAPLEKGSLIMMGGKYWFAVEPKASEELVEILKVRLDKQFEITDSATDPKRLKALPVDLTAPDHNGFSSHFCLRYRPANAEDTAKLTKLSFKTFDQNYYSRCVSVQGRYFNAPNTLPADYRFESSVPVEIRHPVRTGSVNGGKIAKKVFLTPFALAGDALGGILFLPMYVNFKEGPW